MQGDRQTKKRQADRHTDTLITKLRPVMDKMRACGCDNG